MLKRKALVALTVPLTLAAGCGNDPPAPSEVRARIADDLGHVLREGTAAGRAGDEALHADAAFGLFERFAAPATAVYAKRGGTLPRPLRGLPLHRVGEPTGETTDPFDTDRIVEELTTEVFTDANHIGDGIYAIPASLACTTEDHVVDAECAAEFAKLELRVRTETDDDRLILGVQVGANHDEPLRFTLSHTTLAVTIDLDETGRAVTALAPVFGEAPNARLSGEVTGQIEILGTAHAKLSLTFNRPLDIAIADAGVALDSPDALRVTSATANVAALAFDAGAGTGSAVVGLGATTVHVPGDAEAAEPALDLDLGGASMVAMLATNQPMQITHVGLGERTTTLSVGGQRAVTIDLNPNDGRAFGATIAHDPATGLDTIGVSPKLDLHIAIDHAVLGDEPPAFDITRVLLEGSLRTGGADERIEVTSGTFAITTNPAEFGFTAVAGQCVTETIDAWAVGTCL
jgi:hypothetical protein